MKSITTNISMPKGLYDQAKIQARKYHYNSVSELIRDALRWWMNDNLTRNGFTEQFEKEVLRRSAEPMDNDIEWDGVTPFSEFVLTHPTKSKNAKNSLPSKILSGSHRTYTSEARVKGRDKQASSLVSKEYGRHSFRQP